MFEVNDNVLAKYTPAEKQEILTTMDAIKRVRNADKYPSYSKKKDGKVGITVETLKKQGMRVRTSDGVLLFDAISDSGDTVYVYNSKFPDIKNEDDAIAFLEATKMEVKDVVAPKSSTEHVNHARSLINRELSKKAIQQAVIEKIMAEAIDIEKWTPEQRADWLQRLQAAQASSMTAMRMEQAFSVFKAKM